MNEYRDYEYNCALNEYNTPVEIYDYSNRYKKKVKRKNSIHELAKKLVYLLSASAMVVVLGESSINDTYISRVQYVTSASSEEVMRGYTSVIGDSNNKSKVDEVSVESYFSYEDDDAKDSSTNDVTEESNPYIELPFSIDDFAIEGISLFDDEFARKWEEQVKLHDDDYYVEAEYDGINFGVKNPQKYEDYRIPFADQSIGWTYDGDRVLISKYSFCNTDIWSCYANYDFPVLYAGMKRDEAHKRMGVDSLSEKAEAKWISFPFNSEMGKGMAYFRTFPFGDEWMLKNTENGDWYYVSLFFTDDALNTWYVDVRRKDTARMNDFITYYNDISDAGSTVVIE